jgi:hypothetical protein
MARVVRPKGIDQRHIFHEDVTARANLPAHRERLFLQASAIDWHSPSNMRPRWRRPMSMNAADLYRKAFACLPEPDLGDYSRRLGRDDPENDQFVERGRDSLDLLHQAGRCAECSWGDEGGRLICVDVFAGARRLAMLGMLRAEGSFRRGNDRAGLGDLTAVMALGRHVSRGTYISGMAGFPLEDLAITKAFDVLGRLNSESRRALAQALDSLPAFPELSEVLRVEQTHFRETYRERFATLDGRDLSQQVRQEFGLPARTEENSDLFEAVFPAGDPAERMLVASRGTRTGLLALADEALAAFDTLVEITTNAADGSSQRLAALHTAALSNPLLADVLKTFDDMRPLWDRFSKRIASLHSLAQSQLSFAEATDT